MTVRAARVRLDGRIARLRAGRLKLDFGSPHHRLAASGSRPGRMLRQSHPPDETAAPTLPDSSCDRSLYSGITLARGRPPNRRRDHEQLVRSCACRCPPSITSSVNSPALPPEAAALATTRPRSHPRSSTRFPARCFAGARGSRASARCGRRFKPSQGALDRVGSPPAEGRRRPSASIRRPGPHRELRLRGFADVLPPSARDEAMSAPEGLPPLVTSSPRP